ncbi:MAG: PPOX class F420-dependent oxidoreductase [Chloroflexota bacterium]
MAQLTENVRNFLSEPRFAVIATINEDGTPQQTVVWYQLQDDRIMMNTRVGRLKEKNLKRDPRLSFCIEDDYRYVAIKGAAELDYDPTRSQDDIKNLAIIYHGQERGEAMSRNQFTKQDRVTIYMSIDEVIGDGIS